MIVVNASSVGPHPDEDTRSRIGIGLLAQHIVVADVIPKSSRSWLDRDAEARSCTMPEGAGMLVDQGVPRIEHWVGTSVDADVMRSECEWVFDVHESMELK